MYATGSELYTGVHSAVKSDFMPRFKPLNQAPRTTPTTPDAMNETERNERRGQIQAAAFELLKELGYRKSSMLLIAKRAQASNQTLYAWYSNKQALFRSIIEDGGRAVREQLEAALREGDDPLQSLADLGPALLRFTTSEDAITMNRAAVTDATETGVLASAIDYTILWSLLGRC